jgi:hypothetical protein
VLPPFQLFGGMARAAGVVSSGLRHVDTRLLWGSFPCSLLLSRASDSLVCWSRSFLWRSSDCRGGHSPKSLLHIQTVMVGWSVSSGLLSPPSPSSAFGVRMRVGRLFLLSLARRWGWSHQGPGGGCSSRMSSTGRSALQHLP